MQRPFDRCTAGGQRGNFALKQAIDRAIVQRIAANPPQTGLNGLNGRPTIFTTTPSRNGKPMIDMMRFRVAGVARDVNAADAQRNLL
jgi:hypothetical protein